MKNQLAKITLFLLIIGSLAVSASARPGPAAFAGATDSAAPQAGKVYNEAEGETEPAVYIIQLKGEPLATYQGGVPGLAATSPLATGARKLDPRSAASLAYENYLEAKQYVFVADMTHLLGRSIDVRFYYRHAYNGLAVFMSPAEAAAVSRLDDVVLVYREQMDEILTDAGPIFIGADALWGGGYTELGYSSPLDGDQEVPPTGSTATGEGTFTYNFLTKELTWSISHNVAAPTAAHIHQGAAGFNGGVVIPLDHTANPMVGSAILTGPQQAMLVNQLFYVNIHTAAFPGGEIRGQILPNGTMGEGIIVGIIDTGINSGHPSFAAVGGDGYAHTNPYGSGNYVGYCVANPSFCNDKLIGAWALHPSSTNPEDADGHGSHTASTVAGNLLQDAVMVAPTASYTFDAVSGVAPHANIIAYQVCVPSCPTASTTAAVNQAVIDGVDVTNYSISGGTNPYVETTAVAFRNAVAAGVFPANSAGNSGPGAATVGHQGPWIMTVGASTHNRAILNFAVDLNSSNGPLPDIMGQGPTAGYGPAALVYAGDAPYNNPLCNPFPAGTFSGQIVVCDRGVIGRVQKGANVLAGGGGGMILLNDAPSAASLNDDTHVLPATHVSYADGLVLKAWMASGSGHTGRITGGSVDYADYGDNMASFSSRGPAGATVAGLANLIKPDVTAPGLNILAAYNAGFSTPPEFNIISGTSMSSPHGAGAAALIRALHPSWTPAEVKSALMMTGITSVNKEDNTTPGDPFDYGAGRVNLTAAGDVGFVLDITNAEYLAANPATGGDPKLLNLASMANPNCVNVCSWTRTVRSVLDVSQEYNAWVDGPAGVTGTVSPANFTLAPGGSQEITISVNVTAFAGSGWTFAAAHIEPTGTGIAPARMPVAVVPQVVVQPIIDVNPSSLASSQPANVVTAQTLTISNLGVSDLIWTIEEAPGPTLNPDWMDGFDSYANGSNIHGQGGWKGWLNNPAMGALVTNVESRSAPHSVAIAGTNDPVREFSGYTSGQVTITAWQFVPTAFTGTSYFIMLNSYNDSGAGLNWSTQVNFNSANNLVVNDGISGGSLPLIRNQWVEIRVEIDLDSNTQAFYYNNQLLYAGTWTNEVSGGGALNIGVINLFANSATAVYYDDISLSSSTEAAPCDTPADVPWLGVNPTSGTTPPAGADNVMVTFDSTSLADGEYTAVLCVHSNDPVTPLVEVPVTLNVVAAIHDVSITAGEPALEGEPGTTVTYEVRVQNEGNIPDSYGLSVVGNQWAVGLSTAMTGVINPGAWQDITVMVTIPAGAMVGDMDTVNVYANSVGDENVSDFVTLTTTALAVYNVTVTPATDAKTGAPGTTVAYTLQVTNAGNAPDTFSLAAGGNNWTVVLSAATTGELQLGESFALMVSVLIPAGAAHNATDAVVVTATSAGDETESDSSTLTTTAVVEPVYGVELTPSADAKTGAPDTTVIYTLELKNVGDVADMVTLGATGDWTNLPVTEFVLDPEESVTVEVHINIPAGAADGAVNVATVTAVSGGDATKTAQSTLTTTVEEEVAPPVYGVELTPASDARTGAPGQTVIYTLELKNVGEVADIIILGATGSWTHLPETEFVLEPEESVTVVVHINIPAGAADGAVNMATVTATSAGEPTKSASSTLTTTVQWYRIFLPFMTKP
jgi:uncharacterized membrane protein/subtilisin family serine protease